jgi:glycosyltransferase involved in cell wall biosynthesis
MAVSETGNQKLFSIILATYNCGQKVENTLQSIFSQNRELFEVIVLDNASTDDTLSYLKKYESDLTLLSEKDDGVYYAFNKGIELATGKYLYFIGAGDCLRPGILDRVKESLPPAETPAFVYGKCYFVKQKIDNGKKFESKLFIRDNLCQQGIFYHREVFKLIGKFDLQYKILADWMFNLKCFLHDGVTKKYIDCVIADYEEGGLSAEISRDPVFLKEFPRFVKKQFGRRHYFICQAFLKNPYLFNYIYYRKYYLLLTYLTSRSRFGGTLASFVKPSVRGYRSLKKSIKSKISL